MPFLSKVAVRREASCLWELTEPLTYAGKRETFTVPAGFRTDFASVPALVQSIIPRTGPWDEAAVVHDAFCVDLRRYRDQLRTGHLHPDPPMVSARDADALFRRIMREGHSGDGSDGAGPVHRWLMWCGVRWGALGNPARRAGWWRDAPRVLAITAVVLAVAAVLLLAVAVTSLAVAVALLLH